MPHLITNRARQHNLMSDRPAGHLHFSWESVNAILYLIGGFAFIIGSIFFLPRYEESIAVGVWSYFGGSCLYAIVTIHDLLESISHLRSQNYVTRAHLTELYAAIFYTIGTLLFIAGSLFFLPQIELITAGVGCFITGSILFLIGSCINVLQITQAGSLLTLQLLNATAICFLLGSVLFLVASIPYLWTITNQQERNLLFTYVAWEYIVGSFLFWNGGIFNYYRAILVADRHRELALRAKED
ncbi:YrhK family protein [Roseofilum casamattae]|uniref:YrhK family protein n=1 Tax=Roseofilum casamattae BLCC-M143 TaxID=3022442 RepID=A0ABT7BVU1_9CYAN|nr:YrhK family protein [Roseofilum casamattae]MDJ1182629.1 YrhK family protein [Roseofilum casamattae BLCC-M143]